MTEPGKKILLINYEYPPLGGGGGHASEQIAIRLVKMGCEVTVLTSRFRGLPELELRDGVSIVRIPTLRRHLEKCSAFEMGIFLLSSLYSGLKCARALCPDAVISFFSIPSGPAAWLIKRVYGTAVSVVALRGGDVPGFLPERMETLHRLSNWLNRLVWRGADVITANSQGLAELAKRFYPQKDIKVIPNGVDASFFHERAAQDAGPLTVLFAGRLNEQKKVGRLLESFGRLKTKGVSGISLLIAGDGPERERLEARAQELGLEDTVHFVGWCDRERLKGLYRQAQVFALASDYEGMPNVVLEAMASSLAIVATNAPGTEDLVQTGQNGIIVARENLTGFDEAFLALQRDRDMLFKMHQHSHTSAKSYSWDTVTRSYLDLCRRDAI